jgi:PmbA protein
VDDALDPAGPGARPFDDEGVPSRVVPLVRSGILEQFVRNHQVGRRTGEGSTGNGKRSSYRGTPEVGLSTVVVRSAGRPVAELIEAAGDGVHVEELHSLHNISPVSGRFSVGFVGQEITGGRLGPPVRDCTLAGDLVQVLAGIRGYGDDLTYTPGGISVGSPSLLVDGLTAAGE